MESLYICTLSQLRKQMLQSHCLTTISKITAASCDVTSFNGITTY